jgi:hypothetical protein
MNSIEAVILYINTKKEWPFLSKVKSLKTLSGGMVNYVYRLTHEDESTYIIKYFPAYLAVDKSIEMSQNRYFVEKEALKLLGDHELLANNRFRIPKLIYFDDQEYLLVMQDAGVESKTLFDYLKLQNYTNVSQSEEMIDFLARELFNFFVFLKNSGITPTTHQEPFKNEALWIKLRSYLIPLYSSEATRFNLENELKFYIEKANELLKSPSNGDGILVYGDLWPSEFN